MTSKKIERSSVIKELSKTFNKLTKLIYELEKENYNLSCKLETANKKLGKIKE